MKWQDMSSPQLGSFSRETIVVLPTASIEQHGPHLPVGTDSFIGEGIASALDAEFRGQLLILPVQRVGCSEHHMAFPGTLSLRHETFEAVVFDTLASLVRQGLRHFLVLNSHGGNQAIGGVIAEKGARAWKDVELVFTSWWKVAAERLKDLVEGEFPSVGHACEFETSLMLALHPQLVNMRLAVDDGLPPRAKPLQHDLLSGPAATLFLPMDRMTRGGVYGRPTLASAEKGRRILHVTVGALCELIEACWPQSEGGPARSDP
jgi:creatinine amidohydrolase